MSKRTLDLVSQLRRENAELRDRLEDSQLYRGIAENKQRLLHKKVRALEQKIVSLEKGKRLPRAPDLGDLGLAAELDVDNLPSPLPFTTSPEIKPSNSAYSHASWVDPFAICPNDQPFVRSGKKRCSLVQRTKQIRKRRKTTQGSGSKSCPNDDPLRAFSQPDQNPKEAVKMEARIVAMTKKERRDVVTKALGRLTDGKGTVNDIIDYIVKCTSFVLPSKQEITGTINGMCRFGKTLQKCVTNNGKKSGEYQLLLCTDELPKGELDDSTEKRFNKKKVLKESMEEVMSKKKRRDTEEEENGDNRKRMWLYCKHCCRKLNLRHLKHDVRYYVHICVGKKRVMQSLKITKSRFCKSDHIGACLRLLEKHEIPDGTGVSKQSEVAPLEMKEDKVKIEPVSDSMPSCQAKAQQFVPKANEKETAENDLGMSSISQCQKTWAVDDLWDDSSMLIKFPDSPSNRLLEDVNFLLGGSRSVDGKNCQDAAVSLPALDYGTETSLKDEISIDKAYNIQSPSPTTVIRVVGEN